MNDKIFHHSGKFLLSILRVPTISDYLNHLIVRHKHRLLKIPNTYATILPIYIALSTIQRHFSMLNAFFDTLETFIRINFLVSILKSLASDNVFLLNVSNHSNMIYYKTCTYNAIYNKYWYHIVWILFSIQRVGGNSLP